MNAISSQTLIANIAKRGEAISIHCQGFDEQDVLATNFRCEPGNQAICAKLIRYHAIPKAGIDAMQAGRGLPTGGALLGLGTENIEEAHNWEIASCASRRTTVELL
jgi:hypothetical protein